MRQSVNRKQSETRFPLSLHRASGLWCKRIRGKLKYFGRDKDVALAKWEAEKQFLLAGLPVPTQATASHSLLATERVTLETACRVLLTQKRSLIDAGEFSLRTLQCYESASERLIDYFGANRLLTDLRPVDFITFRLKCAEGVSSVTCGNRLRYVRAILRFAYDQDLVDKPIKIGKALALPSQAVIRAERHKRGPLMFSKADILTLLNGMSVEKESGKSHHVSGASPVLRAMLLLSLNCAFGQTDCSRLTFQFLDLQHGWHNFQRPKTAVNRRCPLWPETIDSIRDYLANRPSPQSVRLNDRVFLTRFGDEFVKVRHTESSGKSRITPIDAVSLTFGKLIRKMGIYRPRIGFYCGRRTFQTIAENTGDFPAIAHIMGHAPPSSDMASRYRQKISDERLKAVSDYVRNWLFNS